MNADKISSKIKDAWRTIGPINAVPDGTTLKTSNFTFKGGFIWVPSSVDPTVPERYGLVLRSVDAQADGSWLVNVIFGNAKPVDTGVFLMDPYIGLSMVFDASGNLTTNWNPTVASGSNTASLAAPIITPIPAFGPAVSTVIALYDNVVNLASWFAQFSSDLSTSRLSLSMLAVMIASQTVLGVRAAFSDAISVGSDSKLRAVWKTYDGAFGTWDAPRNSSDQGGDAKLFSIPASGPNPAITVRMWRPTIFVDDDTWSLEVKLDRTRTAAQDDHILATFSGIRDASGARRITAVTTSYYLPSTNQTSSFVNSAGADATSSTDKFNDWASKLAVDLNQSPETVAFASVASATLLGPLLTHIAKAELDVPTSAR